MKPDRAGYCLLLLITALTLLAIALILKRDFLP